MKSCLSDGIFTPVFILLLTIFHNASATTLFGNSGTDKLWNIDATTGEPYPVIGHNLTHTYGSAINSQRSNSGDNPDLRID